jgi:hypothetical protein
MTNLPTRPWLRPALLVFFARLASGFVASYAASRAAGSVLAASYPDGDRVLFEPGGYYLLETLRLGVKPITGAGSGGLLLLCVLGFASLLPLAAALAWIARPKLDAPAAAARGARNFPAFTVLSGATWLVQAVVAFATSVAVGLAEAASSGIVNERTASLAPIAVGLVGAAAVAMAGIVEDLARAAVTQGHERAMSAIREGFRTLVSRPGSVLLAWSLPALAALALVAAAAVVTGLLDVGRPGAWRVALVFLVHQGCVMGVVVLRLRWLSAALGLVAGAGAEASEPSAGALGAETASG